MNWNVMLKQRYLDASLRELLSWQASWKEWLVLAVAMLLAWGLSRRWRPVLKAEETTWQYGAGGLQRVLFPLLAVVFISFGKWSLQHYQPVWLLWLINVLVLAWLLIRLGIYLLRSVFPQARWLRVSERGMAIVIWLVVTLHLTGDWEDFLLLLDSVVISVGKHSVSLLMVLNGLLTVTLTLLITLSLSRALERRLLRAEGLNSSYRVMLSKLGRALLLVSGVMIALSVAGIDLTLLSVFGGALGVGLGFGLQKIASNYVSGFIILLDHSIRLGDLLTVDGRFGEVTRLTARYMVLRNPEGNEAIVPNDTLITSVVTNHSYSDRRTRIALQAIITFDSDLPLACATLLEAAQGQQRILQDPAPGVIVKAFAANGVQLELGFWIADPEKGSGELSSAILARAWQLFRERQIVLAST
ncbi:mechanosensitive ion channel family protein [Leeia sp.]|uniref:mechanosensitive ion channel family protein n=1 Tax=Leeia sp. TaxID=2884678 RepID=UPI0035AE7A79